MTIRKSRSLTTCWLYFIWITVVWAATTYADFLHDLGQRESGLDPYSKNSAGYAGLFQMGELALIDAGYYSHDGTGINDWKGNFTGKDGVISLNNFLSSPDAQIKAVAAYHAAASAVINNLGLNSYIGKTINGVEITQSGLVAGAHLVGYSGLRKYLESNGTVVPIDGNGTPISQYIQKFGGYTIGGTPPSYATVLAAAGSSGMPSTSSTPIIASLPGSTNPTTKLPNAPMASTLSPDQAFYQNTGYSSGMIAETIKLMTAATLLLWLAWTALATWIRFTDGAIRLLEMKGDIIRACILTLTIIALLT